MKITRKNLKKLIMEEARAVLGEENRAGRLERELEVMKSLIYIMKTMRNIDIRQQEILKHVKKD